MNVVCREELHDDVYDKIAQTRTWAVETMTKLSEKFGGSPGECDSLCDSLCDVASLLVWVFAATHDSYSNQGGGGGVR